MRILVTGGAGFIGSHTVRALLTVGHEVVVLDDLSTGFRENLADTGAELRVGDLCDRETVESVLAGVSGVVHLAGYVSVPGSLAKPVESSRINILGTAQLLESCQTHGVGRLVFASSAAVYGDRATIPVREDSVPEPTSPYGVQKLAGEHLCRVAAQHGGPDTVSFRFFNVYGARQSPTSDYAAVIPIFRDRCSLGQPLKIYGDGLQTRDFIHAGDLADGIVRALTFASPFSGEVFNLARGDATTILELAREISREAGVEVPIEHAPERTGDIAHSVADLSKLERVFDWTPPTPLAEGLKRF